MKIGFDAKRYFFNQTGLGNYSRTLIDSLGKYFPENEYLLYSPKKPPFLPQNPLYKVVTPAQKIPFLWRSFGLGKQVSQDKLDIYHGLSQELPVDIGKSTARKIVTVHDLLYLRYPQAYTFWDRKIHAEKLKFACKKADTIIAISQQTKQDIMEYCGISDEKIQVIYQPANDYFANARFLPVEKENILRKYGLSFPFMLYVGAITYRKNVLSLVKTLPFLPQEVHIVLVGKGDKVAEIQHFAHKNGVEKRLHILQNVPTIDLPALYQSAEAFVYPSLFEGFGLPILEAQHCGTPVIVGATGCFPETGGKGAIYVNQKNVEEMAFAMLSVLNEPIFKAEMSRKGRENAASFSAEKQAKEVFACYLE